MAGENDGEEEKKKRQSRNLVAFSGENKLMHFARASSWIVNGVVDRRLLDLDIQLLDDLPPAHGFGSSKV